MAEKCALYWLTHLMANRIKPVWASEYESWLVAVQANVSDADGVDQGGDEDQEEDERNLNFDVDVENLNLDY